MPTNASPAVAADALVVRLGSTEILRGLSLEADRGATTALLGPNGAGKTTFVRCCTGLIAARSGAIRILGEPAGTPGLRARVGLMPQSTGAWSGIRAGELLDYLAGLYADPQPVAALVERLGIGRYAKTTYRRLSGGQQQTVNLAAALVGRPELVFLDEPTAGLDPHARRAVWQLVRELKAAGTTVLLTTHDMDEAAALADRIVILDAGRVAIAGTVDELTRGGQDLESVFLAHTRAGV